MLARTGARTLGVFVLLPVVLLAFVAGTVLYVPAAPVVPALNSYWKWIHVTTIAISSSVLLVSGAASALYLHPWTGGAPAGRDGGGPAGP